LWVYFNHNTRTRLIWNSPKLFKHNASAFILYASYLFQYYKQMIFRLLLLEHKAHKQTEWI
jgi:hypothetical protein